MGETWILTDRPLPRPCRAVFDTNIVISALVFGGRLARLRRSWASGDILPLVCRETTVELLRVLQYPKFRLSDEDRTALLEDYLPFAEVAVLPKILPPMEFDCPDPDDIVFIHLALIAKADALVSGDADITGIGSVASLRILSPETLRGLMGD